MHTFSQKELFSPHSVNTAPLAPPQSSAQLPPTQVIAVHPTTKSLKPICQFMSAWEVIPEVSRWLLSVRVRIYSSIQMQTTLFQWHGAVSNIASKCPGSETRGMLSDRERSSRVSPAKRAGERFLQPLFRGNQKGWGIPPDSRSQAHQQSALQMSVQDDNAETDPGANSPRGLVCVCGFKGCIFSHADNTTSQTLSEVCLRFPRAQCTNTLFSRSGWLWPHSLFQSAWIQHFPPQNERDAHSQLSG